MMGVKLDVCSGTIRFKEGNESGYLFGTIRFKEDNETSLFFTKQINSMKRMFVPRFNKGNETSLLVLEQIIRFNQENETVCLFRNKSDSTKGMKQFACFGTSYSQRRE